MANGHFVISLDFELYWGLFDCRSLDDYRTNILGVRNAIPAILNIFEEYEIKATFATVGFLFSKNKEELLTAIPTVQPSYNQPHFSPYQTEINKIGFDETDDPYHFGYDLLMQIKASGHEIGCHTFCHYFVSEPGQTTTQFDADLKAALKLANEKSIRLTSIVFPRNQYSPEYLEICKANGLITYRGNEDSWLYKPRSYAKESQIRRALRLLDAYINLTGHHCSSNAEMGSTSPINIPSSRFLRPYNPKISFLDAIRLTRIKNGMRYAAKNDLTYHLWWHPHNFGLHLELNIHFLRKILDYYLTLKNDYAFENLTMNELSIQLMEDGK